MFVPRYTEAAAREVVAASTRTCREVLRQLGLRAAGGNYTLCGAGSTSWGISTDHFDPHAPPRAPPARAMPLDEILVEGSTYNAASLKQRLYEEGLKQRDCELCGQGEEWRGRRMALILDHVNGVADDNRLENLRIVCPNCAATLDTHCGRNRRPRSAVPTCGRAVPPQHRDSATARSAAACVATRSRPREPGARRVERPPYEQLRRRGGGASWIAVGASTA